MSAFSAPTEGDSELSADAEALAEALDLFRERLIAADLPDAVVGAWFDAATATWDAVEALTENAGGHDAD